MATEPSPPASERPFRFGYHSVAGFLRNRLGRGDGAAAASAAPPPPQEHHPPMSSLVRRPHTPPLSTMVFRAMGAVRCPAGLSGRFGFEVAGDEGGRWLVVCDEAAPQSVLVEALDDGGGDGAPEASVWCVVAAAGGRVWFVPRPSSPLVRRQTPTVVHKTVSVLSHRADERCPTNKTPVRASRRPRRPGIARSASSRR